MKIKMSLGKSWMAIIGLLISYLTLWMEVDRHNLLFGYSDTYTMRTMTWITIIGNIILVCLISISLLRILLGQQYIEINYDEVIINLNWMRFKPIRIQVEDIEEVFFKKRFSQEVLYIKTKRKSYPLIDLYEKHPHQIKKELLKVTYK